jgi:hypothetical protein
MAPGEETSARVIEARREIAFDPFGMKRRGCRSRMPVSSDGRALGLASPQAETQGSAQRRRGSMGAEAHGPRNLTGRADGVARLALKESCWRG